MWDIEDSLYEVLGVSHSCGLDDVKAAYRRLAFQTHPDRNPNDPLATARFIRVQRAYEILSDVHHRAAYDRGLRAIVDLAETFFSETFELTITFNYYGYDVLLEAMEKAQKEAAKVAAETGQNEAELLSRLLLDPLIASSQRLLAQKPGDLNLLLQLADLYFHTYRAFKALECYVEVLKIHRNWQAAARCEHLERSFNYAGDYWGGARTFVTLLKMYPVAPPDVQSQWKENGIRLLNTAESKSTQGATADRKLELQISFLAKKRQLGYSPTARDLKAIADTALAAGRTDVAREHLLLIDVRRLQIHEVPALMRSLIRAGLPNQAIELGERIMTPERLNKTLDNDYKGVCKALAEAYEGAERWTAALVLYKKLSRYADASDALKKKILRLSTRVTTGRTDGELTA